MNRPPKVRPKNLTIGRSVYLWQNTLDKSAKKNNTQAINENTVDTSVKHVKELEDELLKLRIENAFLKELRRLRLEDEAKMRERRESSTVSEDSSN